jgi:hypothetical protein
VSRIKLTKKRMLVAVSAVVAVAVAGLAFAFWTAGGSGSGSGTTGAGATGGIGVVQTSTVSGLTPGDAGAALSGDFTNSNTQSVHVTSVTATVHTFSSQTDTNKPACTQADYTITGGAVSTPNTVSVGQDIPARAGFDTNPHSGSWSGLTVKLTNNGSANQDNCKGQSITIDYTSN